MYKLGSVQSGAMTCDPAPASHLAENMTAFRMRRAGADWRDNSEGSPCYFTACRLFAMETDVLSSCGFRVRVLALHAVRPSRKVERFAAIGSVRMARENARACGDEPVRASHCRDHAG